MSGRLTPSPGPWAMAAPGFGCIVDANGSFVAKPLSANRQDIDLILEAGAVYHETQLTPRELADQRAELLAALITVRDNMRKGVTGQEARKGWDLVNAAIAKAGAV